MKLIDLLVQELPKRGGWPDGVKMIEQNYHGKLFDGSEPSEPFLFTGEKFEMVDDWRKSRVTREQYEAALAAAQQPAWNGEGLPPVGCECEFYKHSFPTWAKGLIKYASDYTVVIVQDGHVGEIIGHPVNFEFRPIRTEAELKREEAVEALCQLVEYRHDCGNKPIAGWIYAAIAAGKIPGVKLSD